MMVKQLSMLAIAALALGCDSGGDDGAETVGEGDPYPALTVKDCDGNAVDVRAWLADFDASYVTFGAQWCTACQEEAPLINRELVDGLAGQSVGVVQILVENQPDQPPPQALCAAWRDDLSARYTVWVDTEQVHLEPFFAGAIGTLPLHLVVTRDGTVRMKKLGAVPSDIKAIVLGWLPR